MSESVSVTEARPGTVVEQVNSVDIQSLVDQRAKLSARIGELVNIRDGKETEPANKSLIPATIEKLGASSGFDKSQLVKRLVMVEETPEAQATTPKQNLFAPTRPVKPDYLRLNSAESRRQSLLPLTGANMSMNLGLGIASREHKPLTQTNTAMGLLPLTKFHTFKSLMAAYMAIRNGTLAPPTTAARARILNKNLLELDPPDHGVLGRSIK